MIREESIMKVSDYIVEYLISKNITDVFGYPGGMVTYFMDSLSKRQDEIKSHLAYHEQGAAFAACGYAQVSGRVGVAYATSGPGATNLITGICNAYFDSIPTLFITGQVNTFESKNNRNVRQCGFQETDIVSIVKPVTKYAVKIEKAEDIKYQLDYAFHIALSGRKGPVLLDIPMNIFRAEIDPVNLAGYTPPVESCCFEYSEQLVKLLRQSKKPLILLGNGIKSSCAVDEIYKVVEKLKIPVISTMIAVDVAAGYKYNYGFIGAYGNRTANFLASKCDLLISVGARLDVRQVGANRENFAPSAKIVRIDIDEGELSYTVHKDEIHICADIESLVEAFKKIEAKDYTDWINLCESIKAKLIGLDDRRPNLIVKDIGSLIPENTIITTDVGQNQVWVAQSLELKNGQRILFSGGHGAMGYSLPAAVGACMASSKKPTVCFSGDGGIQMNIQELMAVSSERLPIKIILLNNYALGMIRHFQEMYFDKNYTQTTISGGYAVPDFSAIASAYGIKYICCESEEDIHSIDKTIFESDEPVLLEVKIKENTYVFPKLEFGKPNQDQEPLLERKLYEEINNMDIGRTDNMFKNMRGGGTNQLIWIGILLPEQYLRCSYE